MAEEAVVELGLEAGDLGRTRTLGRLVREGNHNILHIFLIFLKESENIHIQGRKNKFAGFV